MEEIEKELNPFEKAKIHWDEAAPKFEEAKRKIQQIVKDFERETGDLFLYFDIGKGNFFNPEKLGWHETAKDPKEKEFYINRIKDTFENQIEVKMKE